ncbi:hypothetical protein NQ314_005817 [Rhamnusium bicolor]|uniref:Amidophosphoribosyltransferase n=1 Tax=Rhamnusium bicolor TaxID=1586634 RepID=A0AAV8ZD00_9CUCU|nr:hypothetical protein NQ314_005817 [Rhamnusium bicolor]
MNTKMKRKIWPVRWKALELIRGRVGGQVNSGLTHECGVFGAIGCGEWPTNLEISQIICWGLVALQHRGQESAGIVTSEGKCSKSFNVVKGMGMISNIFNDEAIRRLKGSIGIGHTRYSTSAASEEVNCQPFVVHTAHGALAVAHNGELVNCDSLRRQVLQHGVGLSTHSDSELITQALCLNPPEGELNGEPDWPARIKHLMHLAPLSYSLVIMLKNKIYAVRDPYGNRPLCLGKILPYNEPLSGECDDSREAEGWVVSSESCGFLSIGAQYVREVYPGEIIEMTRHGIRTIDIVSRPENKLQAFCIFEYVYFARSDSIFEGQMVYAVRLQCGRQLAIEHPVEADIVNDSIVRGNTIGPIIKLLKNAGATEVHIRVASPPLLYPCYMGINIPTREELIANKLNAKELAKHVGSDSLAYLSIEGLIKAVRSDIKTKNSHRVGHCTACLSGIYPGGIPNKHSDLDW